MKEIREHTYKVLRILLHYFQQKEIKSSPEEMELLWERIQTEAARLQKIRQRRHILYITASAAAAIALIVAIVPALLNKSSSMKEDDWLKQYVMTEAPATPETDNGHVILKLSKGEEVAIAQGTIVTYPSKEVVMAGSDTVCYGDETLSKEIDQIYTPAGKQARLLLADGTRVWVNAGTHMVYPRQFEKDRREIFVDGEVYLEVAHNEKAPFFVRTKSFNVQVLGTKFNVSSYQSTDCSSVVLVEGSVKVENHSQDEVILKPEQLIRIQDGQLNEPVKVNVERYTSWTDKLFIYEDEALSEVLKDLELYYGKKFVITDKSNSIHVSGKLELKDTLSKVLHSLSYAFPVTFEEKADTILVITP